MRISLKKWMTLAICILIPLAVGFLSSLLAGDSFQLYQQLEKPGFAPPGWLFAPVWTVLYILMGIASCIVLHSNRPRILIRNALYFYGLQLFLNFLWSVFFFGVGLRFLAFIDILILLVLILTTTIKFLNINKTAGYLMLPYIIWVAYATVLNYYLWILNI